MDQQIQVLRSYLSPVSSFGETPASKGYLHLESHYDKGGNLIKSIKYFEDGTTDEVHTFQYDDKGRVTEERLYYALSENEDITRTSYDDEQRTIEETLYYGEEPADKAITQLDEHGQPINIISYDEDGELVETEVLQYHKPGLISERAYYDEADQLLKKEKTVYNADDEVVEQHIWSADPDEINQTVTITHEPQKTISAAKDESGQVLYTRTHELDDKGHITRLIHADTAGGQYQEQRSQYNEHDKLAMQEWVDAAGNVLRKQLFTYNEQGQLMQETFFEPNPYEAKNNHYVITYEATFFAE